MNGEIVENVSGVSDERIAELVAEAEAGYELDELVAVPNLHRGVPLVPAELIEEIAKRAERDGQTREEVVRRALTRYLAS